MEREQREQHENNRPPRDTRELLLDDDDKENYDEIFFCYEYHERVVFKKGRILRRKVFGRLSPRFERGFRDACARSIRLSSLSLVFKLYNYKHHHISSFWCARVRIYTHAHRKDSLSLYKTSSRCIIFVVVV